MSSGLPVDPVAARQMAYTLGETITAGGGNRTFMSPRQMRLARNYSYYRGSCYDDRKYDWNGDPIQTPYDSEGLGRTRDIPPGFTDVSGSTSPLTARRPSAPYYMARVIVKRFTGMLFSHRRHPKVRMIGDPITEDWLAGAIEAGRLWAKMIEVRDLGGAQGAVGIGFEFTEEATVVFEAFDGRYTTPVFKNRLTRELASIEQKWTYPGYVQNEKGEWTEVIMWCRRYIDESTDTLWQDVYTPSGQEPSWDMVAPLRETEHNFGFVPVEWVQNLTVSDEIDGDPDCHGAFDMIEEADKLNSQANRGVVNNCDPTLVLVTDDESLTSIEKGSEKFIRLNKGETAEYLEMNGMGSKTAGERADALESKVLRFCQCVLDRTTDVQKTATETEYDYSSFHEKCDVLREQYGERGVKRLLAKLVKAVKQVGDESVVVPPREETQPDGTKKLVQRKLGPGDGVIALQWPDYKTATPTDTQTKVQSAANAVSSSLVDLQHAAQYVAPDFQVEDVVAMLASIAQQKAADDAAYQQATVGEATAPVDDATDITSMKFTQGELDAGLVTMNEWRASKGLGPLAVDGDLNIPQFKAKYQQTFAQATVATSPQTAAELVGMPEPGGAPSQSNSFGGA